MLNNALSMDQGCIGCSLQIFFLLCAQNFPIFLHEIYPNEAYGWLSGIDQIKMAIT